MATVTVAEHIRVSAGKVWETAGKFEEIHKWVPAYTAMEVIGSSADVERTLTLSDGSVVREKLVGSTEEPPAYTYTYLDGPLPVEEFISTLMVVPNGDEECLVSWVCSFRPTGASEQDAISTVSAIFKAGLMELKRQLDPI